MVATLIAQPDTILIDNQNGETEGSTFISYTATSVTPFIWERFVGGVDWTLLDLESLPNMVEVPTGNPLEAGTFIEILGIGLVYQVRIYHDRSIDPNDSKAIAPIAQITVASLLKDPEETHLISDGNIRFGGTWLERDINGTRPISPQIQVGTEPPIRDALGLLRFRAPLQTVVRERATDHNEVEVTPLAPGIPHFAVVRAVDAFGNWEFIEDRFTTKHRKLKITFGEIHIVNEGAEGDNTAKFNVWVLEGTQLRTRLDVPEQDISDRPDPVEAFKEHIALGPISAPLNLRPGAEEGVALLTRGNADGDISGNFLPGAAPVSGDEFSGHVLSGAFFNFPHGKNAERVNRPFAVRANPFTVDNEFCFDVKTIFDVRYE